MVRSRTRNGEREGAGGDKGTAVAERETGLSPREEGRKEGFREEMKEFGRQKFLYVFV